MKPWIPMGLVLFLLVVGVVGSSGVYAERGYTDAVLTFIAYWVMWTSAYVILHLWGKR